LPTEAWLHGRILHRQGLDGLAPERCRRGAGVDRANDAYGLAWIATELLTLQPPGPGLWAGVRPPVRDLLTWGLDPSPDRRPPSARAWTDHLLEAADAGVLGAVSIDGPTLTTDPPPTVPDPQELQAMAQLHRHALSLAEPDLPEWLERVPRLRPRWSDRAEIALWCGFALAWMGFGWTTWLTSGG
jgi:hypothetical protein